MASLHVCIERDELPHSSYISTVYTVTQLDTVENCAHSKKIKPSASRLNAQRAWFTLLGSDSDPGNPFDDL